MKRVFRFWKIVVFDLVGIALMILAILTGWLPGPGGIPLFIIGLSILAIHHDWAQKYIDMLMDYVEKIGERIFTSNKDVQRAYDIIFPLVLIGAVYLLFNFNATWQLSLAIVLLVSSITMLLGNRKRWQRLRKKFRNRHKHN